MPVAKDDWRRMGQEGYLKDARLKYVAHYQPANPAWEHEHCSFCGAKIGMNDTDLHTAYCTMDGRHWLCEDCFADFKEEYGWELEPVT